MQIAQKPHSNDILQLCHLCVVLNIQDNRQNCCLYKKNIKNHWNQNVMKSMQAYVTDITGGQSLEIIHMYVSKCALLTSGHV